MVFVVLLLGYRYNATLCHTCVESGGLCMLRSSSNTLDLAVRKPETFVGVKRKQHMCICMQVAIATFSVHNTKQSSQWHIHLVSDVGHRLQHQRHAR
jgi:hypothetical protein